MRLITGSIVLALICSSIPTMAQRVAPETRQDVTLSFAPVVKRTAPSVVNVYGAAKRPGGGGQGLFEDEFFRRFFGRGVPQERAQQSLGSGVIVDRSGLVVTNHHVIEGMSEVKVTLVDRREFEAEIVLRDPRTDLAVLRLKDARDIAALELGNSDALEVGDLVLAIGNPFGVGQTVTQGIVSALARTQVGITDYQFFIQTDAAINPGNSGGALVDVQGRLIGINTAIFSRSGGSHGIGFAIPASMVKVVIESAKGGGRSVRRPWFGASLQVVSKDIADAVGLDRPSGALVSKLTDSGPAAQAGLKRGDVIIAMDGQPVDDPEAFGFRFATKGLSGQTSLTVMRQNQKIVVPVKLMLAPETTPRDSIRISLRSPLMGATVGNLSPALAEELSLEANAEGVAISDLDPAEAAAQLGFQKGDIIVAVNGVSVEKSRDLERMMRERRNFWRFTINRGGQVFTTVFGG